MSAPKLSSKRGNFSRHSRWRKRYPWQALFSRSRFVCYATTHSTRTSRYLPRRYRLSGRSQMRKSDEGLYPFGERPEHAAGSAKFETLAKRQPNFLAGPLASLCAHRSRSSAGYQPEVENAAYGVPSGEELHFLRAPPETGLGTPSVCRVLREWLEANLPSAHPGL